MTAPRFRFGRHDKITIRGIARRWIDTVGDAHVFERLDGPGCETFDDAALGSECLRQDWAYERNGLSPERVKAKALSSVASFEHIPAVERAQILWRLAWCEGFLELESKGEATRSDARLQQAIGDLAPRMLSLAIAKLPLTASGRRRRGGTKVTHRLPPSVRNLRRWLARLAKTGNDASVLRTGYRRCGDRGERFEPAIEALVNLHANSYASETRPTKASCHADLATAVNTFNKGRTATGSDELACPSLKALGARIAALPAFETYSARHGLEAAQRKFAVLGQGLDVTRAGERVEMDEWEVQLQTLLIELMLWEALPPPLRAAIERVKVWVCAAIDAASRCILGMSFSRTARVENACSALHMVLRDKQAYAEEVDAQSPWDMVCTPESLVTDGGSSFIADDFKSRVVAVLSSPHTTPSGNPGLRARNERFFSTAHKQPVARFPGRTFSNIVDKGAYDSEARAAATVTMICEALLLWVVDVYHNKPHAGLGGETPRNAWKRLVATYGVSPPPGRNKLRHVFGIELERDTGRHGVAVLNLNYQDEALQAHRRQHGDRTVRVRVDPLDLGRVSVLLGKEWHTCACMRRGFADVSVEAWTAAASDLRRRHAADAKLSEQIVFDAIRAIQSMARMGIDRFDLGSTRPSAETIGRAERDLFIGFRMPDPDDDQPERPRLLSGAVEGTGPLSSAWHAQRGIEPEPAPGKGRTPPPAAEPRPREPLPDEPRGSEPRVSEPPGGQPDEADPNEPLDWRIEDD